MRNHPRPALFLAALLAGLTPALGPLPASAPALAQEAGQLRPPEGAVRIVNRTGQPATALHAVRSGRTDWGSNLLNRGPLPNNAGFTLRPNAEAGCRFDIRLVLEDGRESLARDQDICANRQLELHTASAAAPPTPSVAQARPNPQARNVSTGTGFVVAPDRVLTNQHVVAGCDRILARAPDGRWLAAVPPAQVDAALDLSILRIPGNPGPALSFRAGPAVRRGEGVVAYGFPLTGLLSADPKLTRGEINALGGIRNDQNNFQISAEVQPGNSGGPLLDMQGHVVGVVVAKLDSRRVQNVDNVNFAVKGEAAQAFLRRAGLSFQTAESRGPERSAADVGDIANRSTVLLRCER
ncbi:trypsin-like peptidase domain-containing protein [Falsiroseomonas tokyonensis]|uniref:Trypsin-like peptidase domain-containing protein n=1 Tax=Falsiroseomonas tokyonensis TaxID=430521 RepID=A0ABV7BPP7_9PROT|nr:trypsin-like peptidase domain-containing protein [Falsiroseomonas tokyonensis]MBU8537200.1 trypsin-like peptidase domain-containing protein [Falsiroseomonas tokyonensis]